MIVISLIAAFSVSNSHIALEIEVDIHVAQR